jgi:hypothetical protein
MIEVIVVNDDIGRSERMAEVVIKVEGGPISAGVKLSCNLNPAQSLRIPHYAPRFRNTL